MKHLTLSILSIAAVSLTAQGKCEGKNFTFDSRNGRNVTIEFVNDNVVRISNSLAGETTLHSGAAANPGSSCGVTTQTLTTRKGGVMVSPSGLTVSYDTTDGSVNISAGPGRGISDSGMRTLSDGKRAISLATLGSGQFYGAGERGHSFNLCGDTLVMYNRQNYGYTATDPRISQMNITMPLFVSSNGYAVVFDDFSPATMIMGNPIKYITESPTPVAYYFINGAGSLEGVARELSNLTGRQPLPPFWSLGYITSKYGYRTEAETRGVVDTLKSKGYPLDGIVLDLYWYGKEEDMGRLEWDPEQWPTHKAMLSDLRNRGVNTIIISQPYVLRNGRAIDNYNNLSPRGIFMADSTGTQPQEVKIWVGEGGMFDVSNPQTRQWLAERYHSLTEDGVGGWWGDLGEPEVHPETGLHANGLSARLYHNRYGNDWSSIISDMFSEKYPDRRLMTMMRGGTTGLQRYSVYPWSTDVSRSWGGMQPQINIMLNSGLSGLGYMSHDVGGFAVDKEHPVDPELYVRWLQLGTFSPVLRTHATVKAEPYHYPELAYIIEPLIKDRYRWLPYNYTLAWENASMGYPLVRPINFHSAGAEAPAGRQDEFLWGRDLLVAPVMEQGATERTVIFPEGSWIDMKNSSNIYAGGDTITYAAPLEVLPLFVRAGAFIPMADYPMENTGQFRSDRYLVKYYPVEGVASSYTMFDDNRTSTTSLADGNYSLLTFKGNDTDSAITISLGAEGTYDGMPARRSLTFEIMNVDRPASVTLSGKKAKKWKYDSETRILTIPVVWNNDSTEITIFKK